VYFFLGKPTPSPHGERSAVLKVRPTGEYHFRDLLKNLKHWELKVWLKQ
jgi:hypothetical protein